MGRTLIESNPYLRDPVARRRAILRSVATSSAIEGIRAPFRELERELLAEENASKPPVTGKAKQRKPSPAPGTAVRLPRGKTK